MMMTDKDKALVTVNLDINNLFVRCLVEEHKKSFQFFKKKICGVIDDLQELRPLDSNYRHK